MRRALAVLLVLSPAAACGFPDVSYDTGTDAGKDRSAGSSSGSSSGSGDDSSSSSGGGVDAEGDSRMGVDGSSSGDSTTPDGPGLDAPQDTYVAMIDAPPDSPLCDVDHDGFVSDKCGGPDCCDTDWSAKPGQTMFFTSADMCGSYDYNCDNVIETETKVNVTCSGLATSCNGQAGFTSDPACGTVAPFYNCLPSGLGCSDQSTMPATQACH